MSSWETYESDNSTSYVFGCQDINDIYTTIFNLENNETDVKVTGNPTHWAKLLDWKQGDVYTDVGGDCGLVSSANFLTMCGIKVDEREMIHTAIEKKFCFYDPYADSGQNGGTNAANREQLLELYGVDVTVYEANSEGGSINSIAKAIENGQAVMISVNAGYLWDNPNCVFSGTNNHVVTVTGVERNAATGEVTGLVICDSGRRLETDACRTVSVAELKECYVDIPGTTAIISDKSYK